MVSLASSRWQHGFGMHPERLGIRVGELLPLSRSLFSKNILPFSRQLLSRTSLETGPEARLRWKGEWVGTWALCRGVVGLLPMFSQL